MIKSRYSAVIAAAFVSMASAAALIDTVKGTVSDSATSAPLGSVTVSAQIPSGDVTAETKTDGSFSIALPYAGVGVLGSGSPGPRVLWNAEKSEFTWPDVSGEVTLRILDLSGRTVAGYSSRAGKDGAAFSIAKLPAGAYSAVIRANGRTARAMLAKPAATHGTYDLTFAKGGYKTRTYRVDTGTENPIQVKMEADKGVMESLAVPGDGSTVTSKAVLDSGELFLLKAVGAVDIGGQKLDAEFGGIGASGPGKDSVGGVDVGVDFGLKTLRITKLVVNPPGRMKWFGPYRADHTYHVIVEGTGKPLSLKLVKGGAGPAAGSITVSVALRLTPPPAPVGNPLDTLHAHFYKDTVHTHITTALGSIYLLQCDGQGKVGGARLGMGDAENMDYDVNGGGRLDVGDGNTDYGLGVDEIYPGPKANTLTPRKNWWGNFRKDHIYYQLFAGTGKPIAFEFFDVGSYGDNSRTEFMVVRVFPVP